MTKSPHLIRAEQYLMLFTELSAQQTACGEALDEYLKNPTPGNKRKLDTARDAMNKARVETTRKRNEIEVLSR